MTPEQAAILASSIAALIGAVAAVASAAFAYVAVRAQRRAQELHVRVRHENVIPIYGGVGRNLAGSQPGELWFAILVHNDSLLPVTVKSVAVAFEDGGTAPFIRPAWPGADELPKAIAAGDDATFYLDEVRKIAEVHAEHRGAKWVTATIGGGAEFHGKRIDKKWLDGWGKRAAREDA
jgi:hypothetical protein